MVFEAALSCDGVIGCSGMDRPRILLGYPPANRARDVVAKQAFWVILHQDVIRHLALRSGIERLGAFFFVFLYYYAILLPWHGNSESMRGLG